MRNAFAEEIENAAGKDERVFLLTGDLGNNMFNSFKNSFGPRFLNCGVAEANMISMAAGMAMSGKRPFVYSIVPFLVARPYEQIRNDLCYHDEPVVLVGCGGGYAYGSQGSTHHGIDDVNIMRGLPNMTVSCPADAMEVKAMVRASFDLDGPMYLRLGKKNEPVVHEHVPDFTLGEAHTIREGTDVCFLNAGILLPNVLEAADQLDDRGISTEVISFHTVKPLDDNCLERVFDEFELVVGVDEHSSIGGLGSAICEWIVDHDAPSEKFVRKSGKDQFIYETLDQEDIRKRFGLTPDDLTDTVLQKLDTSPTPTRT